MTPKLRLGDFPARTLFNNSLFFYDINPHSRRRRLSALICYSGRLRRVKIRIFYSLPD
jgi:hypothetical protein